MSFKKVLKIFFLTVVIIITAILLILHFEEYGTLIVMDHPSYGGFAIDNILIFVGVFFLLSLILYTVCSSKRMSRHKFVTRTIAYIYYAYSLTIVIVFFYSSIKLSIRSQEPGANIRGYFDEMLSMILSIAGIFILVVTIILSNWLARSRNKENKEAI